MFRQTLEWDSHQASDLVTPSFYNRRLTNFSGELTSRIIFRLFRATIPSSSAGSGFIRSPTRCFADSSPAVTFSTRLLVFCVMPHHRLRGDSGLLLWNALVLRERSPGERKRSGKPVLREAAWVDRSFCICRTVCLPA